MQIRSAQKLAWENKVVKGFDRTVVPLEFCLLQGEIAEAFDAWRKGREDVGEELADVAIDLLSLAGLPPRISRRISTLYPNWRPRRR